MKQQGEREDFENVIDAMRWKQTRRNKERKKERVREKRVRSKERKKRRKSKRQHLTRIIE